MFSCRLVPFRAVCYHFVMGKYAGFTDARRRANDRYAEKLDSFSIRTSKEHGQEIRSAAARAGVSLNQYVLDAINARLQSEQEHD